MWSNFAAVSHSPYEFTLDFVRLEFAGDRPLRGVVVQRVNMSPQFVEQLIAALSENMETYAANFTKSVIPSSTEDDNNG